MSERSESIRARMRRSLSGGADLGATELSPALRCEVTLGDAAVETVALIDTGADVSVISEEVWKTIPGADDSEFRRVLLRGQMHGGEAKLVRLDVELLDDQDPGSLRFSAVPCVVAKLGRKVLLLGRQGILEWLRISLDYPRRHLTLTRVVSLAHDYPGLAESISGFDVVEQLIREGSRTEALMRVAVGVEEIVRGIFATDPDLHRLFERSSPTRRPEQASMTVLAGALSRSERFRPSSQLLKEFAEERNIVAHGIDRTEIQGERFLDLAEAVVLKLRGGRTRRVARVFVSRHAGAAPHFFERVAEKLVDSGIEIASVDLAREGVTDAVFEAIRKCDGFLQIVSRGVGDSADSEHGWQWLAAEYGAALALGLPRIRFVDDAVVDEPSWKGQSRLDRDVQALSFSSAWGAARTPETFEKAIAQFLVAVRRGIDVADRAK